MSDYANLMQWLNFPEDRDQSVCQFCKEPPGSNYGHCSIHHTDSATFHPSGGWDDVVRRRHGLVEERPR